MGNGPLIPGMSEFDAPRKRLPAWVWWVASALGVVLVLVVLGGFFGGVGPLRSVGLVSQSLQPVSYRPTTVDAVIQVAVALPASSLCPDAEIVVQAFERGPRVEVEATAISPRTSSCPSTGITGDRAWVDVQLRENLGERTVIRTMDRQPLPRDSS